MKKLAYILAAAALIFSCAKEEINLPSEGQVPEAASYEPVIVVDQETNQVTFSVDAKAVVPVWVFQAADESWSVYNTGNGFKKIFTKAGDYSVRMHVMNAAGMSPDYVQKSFHVDNTLVSFDKYYAIFAKSPWHIDGNTEAHMACGESVENPTGWWKAPKNDKAAFGVYDNLLSFTATGDYTFDPGTSGTVYVNIGVTVQPYVDAKGDATADYTAPAALQTTKYKFEVVGEDVCLVLEDGALFPYIPNDDFVKNTSFIVKEFSAKSITLVWFTPTGNGGGPIAWQFILTNQTGDDNPGGGDTPGGYTYGPNLLEGLELKDTWFSGADWNGGLDPQASFSAGKLTLTVPAVGGEEWKGQVKLVAPIPADPAKQYAFFATIESSTDGTCTVKVADAAADAEHAFFYDNNVKLKAFEPLAYKNEPIVPDQAYESVMVIFDFGRMAEGTSITVTDIELKEITGGTPGGGGQVGYTYGPELLGGLYVKETWFSASGWGGGLDPNATFEGGKLTLTTPEGIGGEEWMGQVKLVADVPADPEKQYSFSANVEGSSDGFFTVKVADAGNDKEHAFFYDNTAKMTAYETVSYKKEPISPDGAYAGIMVIFDFGRIPAGTEITVTGISLKEITGSAEPGGGDQGGSSMNYDDADNVWKAADADHTYSQYYATTNSWTVLPNPEITQSGNSYSFSLPTETMNQWQAQFFIIPTTPIPLSAEKSYDFQCKVELSQEVKQVTFKLTDTTDDGNFLFTERRDIAAYEEFTFTLLGVAGIDAAAVKMVFDFGGNPANTDVTIKDIILREHK